jgi:hypothetical protein
MDYKEQLIENIIANCIGLFNNTQLSQLENILNVSMYRYDIFLKEECKDLPANIDDLKQ